MMFLRKKAKRLLIICFSSTFIVTLLLHAHVEFLSREMWKTTHTSGYLELKEETRTEKPFSATLGNGSRKYTPVYLHNTSTTNKFDNTDVFLPFNFSHIPLRIYVYDLPPKFNKYIVLNVTKKRQQMCGDLTEGGYGYILHKDNDLSVQNTWQFSLEVIIHNKILHSLYITDDYSQANLFYIPFYSGLSCILTLKTNYTEADISQVKLLTELQAYLENHHSNAFRAGLPHVMTLSKIEKEQAVHSCPILNQEGFKNVYFLGIERSLAGVKGSQIHPLTVIPYPSMGHLLDNVTASSYLSNMYRASRNITIFMAAGSRNTGQPRAAIQSEFKEHKTILSFKTYNGSKSHGGIIKAWLVTSDCNHNLKHVLEWMQHSLFCLQPAGDSPTRKSFYDSVIAGCIPVLFRSHYKVYYPFEKYLNYSSFTVTLDQTDITVHNKTVEELLLPFIHDHALIAAKQRNLQTVAGYVQYGVIDKLWTESDDAMIFVYKEMRNILQ